MLLFAATIDRFESLKGLGIEAKTRQLDEKIEEADQALRRLRELAELSGAAVVDLNSRIGRWDSAPSPREAYALAQRVRSILKALGSQDSVVRKALEPWMRIAYRELAFAIVRPLSKSLDEKIGELDRQRSAALNSVDPNDPELMRTTSTIKAARDFLEQRLPRIYQFELDDYPERFIQVLDDVPLVDQETLEKVRAKARRFAPDMRYLRDGLALQDPEPWFTESEEARR